MRNTELVVVALGSYSQSLVVGVWERRIPEAPVAEQSTALVVVAASGLMVVERRFPWDGVMVVVARHYGEEGCLEGDTVN